MSKFEWGTAVRLKETGEEGVIDRVGINAGVYSVIPSLGGLQWHTADELEAVDDVGCTVEA